MARKASTQNTADFLKELKDLSKLSSEASSRERVISSLNRVYLIHGEEYFIRERATKRLKEIAQHLGFGIERVTFDKINMEDWTSSLYDVSMFNPAKLVIASELSDLNEAQLEILLKYLKDPSPDVILLLLSNKIDKRKKTSTEIIKKAKTFEAESPDTNTYPKWIKAFASERGKTIDDNAVEYLKTRYEGDLARIEKEIEKASSYVGTKSIIKEQDVEFLTTGNAGVNIFQITSFLRTKNKKKFLENIHKLLQAGEAPIVINSIIHKRIKKLLMSKDILTRDPNISDNELAKLIDYNTYYLREIKTDLLHYSTQELANMYKRCMNIDSQLKSSRNDVNNVFTVGMLKLLERN
ncbi:MAG TPA: DNA polymerase III subunit delta [bacterium]|nr:DNA polymerase III subunit delta [bacterium]